MKKFWEGCEKVVRNFWESCEKLAKELWESCGKVYCSTSAADLRTHVCSRLFLPNLSELKYHLEKIRRRQKAMALQKAMVKSNSCFSFNMCETLLCINNNSLKVKTVFNFLKTFFFKYVYSMKMKLMYSLTNI